jgi:uncharacterized protein
MPGEVHARLRQKRQRRSRPVRARSVERDDKGGGDHARGSCRRAAIAAADTILADVGIKQSIALVVPAMMSELEQNVTKTRPEIKDSLRQTLQAIKPEFDKTAEQTYNAAATLLAQQMSEKDIVDVAAFFESPAGKKYLVVEPVFRQKFSSVAVPWQDKLSTDILVRAREEMRKKGIEF